ncbi:hypothetical protein EYF80_031894 [Liparis tanakae]|uniref:Uncharacterized protein n=1 Tax=Liparis tanakae TaxID=230148 RepID=A0A4Z2GXR1_9TELE|nr:hypothetical protein EYF80_031894 [Liparis tanakae]
MSSLTGRIHVSPTSPSKHLLLPLVSARSGNTQANRECGGRQEPMASQHPVRDRERSKPINHAH